jgi:hypothetical protein
MSVQVSLLYADFDFSRYVPWSGAVESYGVSTKWTFLKRRHRNSQQVYVKMLNINDHQDLLIKNTMRYHITKVTSAAKDVEKRELLVGM